MIIRKSGSKFTLYRYGGVFEGKNLEVRVGSIPVSTRPEAISKDLLEDLTPKEVKALREELGREQQALLKSKISLLVADLNDVSSALDSGLLDAGFVEDLHTAASGFLKRSRRVITKPSGMTSRSEST